MYYIIDIMNKHTLILFPRVQRILAELGGNIKLARLRRKFSSAVVAERAGISRATLWQIEKGSPSVSLGAYIQVLSVLGLEKDFLQVARDDVFGRKLQDIGLQVKKRSPKQRMNQPD